jgi:hypothetical protein
MVKCVYYFVYCPSFWGFQRAFQELELFLSSDTHRALSSTKPLNMVIHFIVGWFTDCMWKNYSKWHT